MTSYRAAPGVAHVRSEQDGRPIVHLVVLPDGPFVELAGPAALIWDAALTAGPEDLVPTVARAAGVDPEMIADQVPGFVAELLDRRLLVTADDLSASSTPHHR